MIRDVALAWATSSCFGALGVISLVALVRSRTWSERGSYLVHLLMSASMAIMPWEWSLSVPAILQVVGFTAAALWYAGLGVLSPEASTGPAGAGHRHHIGYLIYHAAMMAAMVWMTLLMTLMMGGSTSRVPADHMGHMANMGQPMSAMTTLWQQPIWVVVVTMVFVAMFVLAAVWFLVELIRLPGATTRSAPLSETAQTLLNLLMAAAMAVSFLVMS